MVHVVGAENVWLRKPYGAILWHDCTRNRHTSFKSPFFLFSFGAFKVRGTSKSCTTTVTNLLHMSARITAYFLLWWNLCEPPKARCLMATSCGARLVLENACPTRIRFCSRTVWSLSILGWFLFVTPYDQEHWQNVLAFIDFEPFSISSQAVVFDGY